MIAALLLVTAFSLPPQKSDAVVGVAAIHVESGRRLSVRGDERFPMGSVYKLLIGMAVLHRVDEGTLDLRQSVTIEPKDFAPGWSPLRDNAKGKAITLTLGELLMHMVSISDNTACDNLLRITGGSRAVSQRMAALGLGGLRVDRSETQITADLHKPDGRKNYVLDPRDTATPDDMAALLFAIARERDGLSKSSHALLVKLMTETATGPRRIKRAMPAGAIVAHKTGTMPGTTNDAALVTTPDGQHHFVIVVLTKGASGEHQVAEDDIAAIAKKIYDELSRSAAAGGR